MKLADQTAGIVAYGAMLPAHRVSTSIIAHSQGKGTQMAKALGVRAKTVPSADEDTITLATMAGQMALERFLAAGGQKQNVDALFIGSESHPYAVKPSGTVVKEALGLSDYLSMADLQFACKAGSQAMQIAAAYVSGKMAQAVMAIGADTAQARPGDALEYTAAAGAAAFIFTSAPTPLARLIATQSVATDTPDFWRKPYENYPQHFGRFTGEPAYFKHVMMASRALMKELDMRAEDFDHCIFHTPNAKFPQQVAKRLGFTDQQLEKSLVVREIGNTYAAASPLALAAVLDSAQAGEKILMCSYGSGAGADAFVFETTDELIKQRQSWSSFLTTLIEDLTDIDLGTYQQMRNQNAH